MDLSGQNALVTGGAVRLGRALVELLAAEGCRVAIHHHSSREEADELRGRIEDRGGRVVVLRGDLVDPEVPDRLLEEAVAELGSLEILVNNASVFPHEGFAETSRESWDRQMAIGLRAPFLLCRGFASLSSSAPVRQILNVTDRRVRRPACDHFAYRLAKLGLTEMTRMLALELAPDFRVNAIAPGALLPPPGESDEAFRARAASTVPLGVPGGEEALVRAARFLLTAEFETGVVLPVDGGEFL